MKLYSIFRDWPIARKISLVLLLAAGFLFGGMTVFLSQRVSGMLKEDSLSTLRHITQANIDMIDAYGRSLRMNVNGLGNVFAASFPEAFTLKETLIYSRSPSTLF